jgi:hypothetical protein
VTPGIRCGLRLCSRWLASDIGGGTNRIWYHTRSIKDSIDRLLDPYERLLKRKHSVVGGF